jgi:cytochrome P450
MGSRTCIGRHISMLEMTKLIPRIVRDLNFQLDGAGAVGDQVWPTQSYWFVKPTDFKVKVVSERKL